MTAVSLHSVLWTVDHTSLTTCRYLPGFYTGTNIYCSVTEAQRGQDNLPKVAAQQCPSGNQTRDLSLHKSDALHVAVPLHPRKVY